MSGVLSTRRRQTRCALVTGVQTFALPILFLFKSFPIAMVTRHWARALSAPTLQGRAGYLSAVMASTTVLGMAALQTQQVVSGKDPRDMTDSRTWIPAIMRGGALSIFGDRKSVV